MDAREADGLFRGPGFAGHAAQAFLVAPGQHVQKLEQLRGAVAGRVRQHGGQHPGLVMTVARKWTSSCTFWLKPLE
jgi:hypothetical protein